MQKYVYKQRVFFFPFFSGKENVLYFTVYLHKIKFLRVKNALWVYPECKKTKIEYISQNQQKNSLKRSFVITLSVSRPDLKKAV